jgi:hypothetical protein
MRASLCAMIHYPAAHTVVATWLLKTRLHGGHAVSHTGNRPAHWLEAFERQEHLHRARAQNFKKANWLYFLKPLSSPALSLSPLSLHSARVSLNNKLPAGHKSPPSTKHLQSKYT